MGKRVRCPLCGMLVWASQVSRSHSIDVKDMTSRGKGHGFRFTDSVDHSLVALVKSKIKNLYERFFPESKIQLEIPIIPRVFVNKNPELILNPSKMILNPSILVKTGVKIVG